MNHSLILSLAFYICGCFYMVFGAYTVVVNAKSNASRLYLAITSSLAIWAFSYSISNSAPTAESSAFWRSFSTFGWGVFYSLLLHFVMILTKTESRFKKRITLAMIYIPALINIILFAPYGFHSQEQYQMVRTDFGWANTASSGIWDILFIVYYLAFSVTSIALLIRWWKRIEPNTSMKRQITYFLISVLFPFFFGIITETLPAILGINYFPKLVVIFMMIPVTTLFLASRKLGLLLEREKTISLSPKADMSIETDRSRLFETAAAIFTLGSALSFLVGYFGMKKELKYELMLSAALLLMGTILRVMPLISKKKSIQNTVFLAVAVTGFLYIMIKSAEEGAVTAWAVYILFFLFTVILDSLVHAFTFAAISIIFHVILWIIYPEVSVIIDGNEYITRIFIIILSFIAVRYLTNEYALKIQGYQRYAREQEALEKISSSFITINSGNAREKIDEMFEMAVEILGYDHAFLIGFDKDHEYATLLNVYVKDVGSEPFLYSPGIKFKTADLPLFKHLIDQNTPIKCEDTTSISYDEAGKQKDYFMSRGVCSFFAMPITIDDRTGGVFVVEYKSRVDKSLAESRLSFLKIIANIVGDAKKKTLYEERLYNFAYFDEATKLANRNMLRMRLQQMIDHAKGSERTAIIDIELENLRMINDTFGHSTGEQVMIKSAAILEDLLGECCDISRVGEGEFVVVMPHVKHKKQIEECAGRLLAAFSQPVSTATGIEVLFVVVHLGISVYPDDGKDADTLLKNADLARYEAENTNEKIVFYTERLESHIAENTLFTNRLFRSLKHDEFFLEFQPQVSCETGKTVGIEALLRWTSDGNTRVPPDRFIPILEQTGLIYDVGLWVLEQALQEHKRLIAKGFPPLRVSVNLSVVQFQEEKFIPDFTRIIKESRVNPRYIELEITESLLSKNPDEVIKKLHKLKELGLTIAIDDFGRGYSSLHRLELVPFDRIKIDKGIIDYLDVESEKASITKSIIQLAKAYSASVTAEGVETKEQADFLRSAACDEIQGFYYSRPLSVDALEKTFKKE